MTLKAGLHYLSEAVHYDKDTFLKPSDFENWFTQMFLVAVVRYADYVSE